MKKTIIDREKEVIFQTYNRLPIIVSHASGNKIYDKEGREYLDFLAGIAVNALGHCHPDIVHAVKEQAEKYMHLSNFYYQPLQIKLAEKLKSITGYDRIFFTNSGTEAVDGSIKLARRACSGLNKINIVGFSGGFHGRTYGALSVMDKPLYKEAMGPFLPNMKVIEYNDVETLNYEVDARTCAVILEFIQGEGGIVAASKDFVEALFELKNEFDFLVIADEIQSGTGRTGNFLSFEHYGVKPDIVILAKGLGGGLPLGAILAVDSLKDVWERGMHGSTYGGNALSCAAGLVVVEELIEGAILESVKIVGSYFYEQLQELKNTFPEYILEVRGRGLMLGLLLSFEASKLVQLLLEKRIIANATAGNVLRILPPLIIGFEDVDQFIIAIYDCFENLS